MNSHASAISIVLAAMMLTACATSKPATSATTMTLSKTRWIAQDVNGAGLVSNSRITLEFGDGEKLAGSGGCNKYFGAYHEAGPALTVSGVGSTKMACAPPLMDQESKYLNVLSAAKSFAMNADGGLVITAADQRSVTLRPDGS